MPRIFLPPPASELDLLLVGMGVLCCAYLSASALLRVRVRRPRRPRGGVSPFVGKTLSGLGLALALCPPAQASKGPDPLSARGQRPPWSRAGGFPPPLPLAREGARGPSVHPAVHAHREGGVHDRLFPRAGVLCRTHTVVAGDTLWGIAARVLATDDPRRIARYWPKIHRANHAAVPDPNLIRPGQVLRLPDECDA